MIFFHCKRCRQQVDAISEKGWCAGCRQEYSEKLRALGGQQKPAPPRPPPVPDEKFFTTERERKLFTLGVLKGQAMASTGWQRAARWKRYFEQRRKLDGN